MRTFISLLPQFQSLATWQLLESSLAVSLAWRRAEPFSRPRWTVQQLHGFFISLSHDLWPSTFTRTCPTFLPETATHTRVYCAQRHHVSQSPSFHRHIINTDKFTLYNWPSWTVSSNTGITDKLLTGGQKNNRVSDIRFIDLWNQLRVVELPTLFCRWQRSTSDLLNNLTADQSEKNNCMVFWLRNAIIMNISEYRT